MKNQIFSIGKHSILGNRESQQDSLVCEQEGSFLMAAVCDGMGGMSGGEIASRLAVESFYDRLHRMAPASIHEATGWIKEAFTAVDERIASLTDDTGKRIYAGSTAIITLLEGDKLHWGSVGDSRIYYIQGEQIRSLTRMHNYNLKLDEMIRRGELSREEKERQGERGEALISYLGIGGLPIIDTSRDAIRLNREDVVLLCSDGLYKTLEDEQIAAIVGECGGNMKVAAKRLCTEALRLAARKQDNTTVIAIRYTGSEENS